MPARAAHACGALGRYDRDRVRAMAELLGSDAFVHEDDSSALILDREPVGWGGGRQRGIGWVEGDARQPPAALPDWRAAAEAGICGLVLDGRRRYLHSAVNGLAPLYWLEQGGAVYFASRIDPLVRTAPARLSIDWEAWAAILSLRFPVGNRTPFAEIGRLPEFSTLQRRRFSGAQVREERWPWLEIEPDQTVASAAEGAAAALEELLAPLPGGIVCPLSGGRDSRILLSMLARDGRVVAAVTVPDDDGGSREEDLAAPVATAFGVPHERLRGSEAGYPAEWEERARRTEYQVVDNAWLVPMALRVDESPAPVPDGFAIDVFAAAGRNFFNRETFDLSTPRAASQSMFDSLRQYGHATVALEQSFQEPVVARAREQFLAAVKRFEGHPHQVVFDFYATRSRRGVSTYPAKLVGDRSWAITPGAADPFVQAALSIDLEEKRKGELYRGILEIVAPELAALPSTADVPRRGQPHLPRRWCSKTAVEAHRRSLLDGPLAPHLSPQLRAWIEGPVEAEPDGHLRVGIEAVSLLHSWWRRYRDHLRDLDPLDLRG